MKWRNFTLGWVDKRTKFRERTRPRCEIQIPLSLLIAFEFPLLINFQDLNLRRVNHPKLPLKIKRKSWMLTGRRLLGLCLTPSVVQKVQISYQAENLAKWYIYSGGLWSSEKTHFPYYKRATRNPQQNKFIKSFLYYIPNRWTGLKLKVRYLEKHYNEG